MYCTGIGPLACCWGGCRWAPALPRRGSSWRRRRKIFEVAAEEANLVVREVVWVENADFGITLLHLHLVERSILVYGKWGQFGHLEGARGGHVVCLNPLIWRSLPGGPAPGAAGSRDQGPGLGPCTVAVAVAASSSGAAAGEEGGRPTPTLGVFPTKCCRPPPVLARRRLPRRYGEGGVKMSRYYWP